MILTKAEREDVNRRKLEQATNLTIRVKWASMARLDRMSEAEFLKWAKERGYTDMTKEQAMLSLFRAGVAQNKAEVKRFIRKHP